MTKVNSYPEYKETGLKWLGRVPSSWGIVPLWTLYSRGKTTDFSNEELLSVYRDHGVVPKSSRDDNFNKPSDDLSAYQLVKPGDMVINKMKAWQGSVAISRHRGIVSPAYYVYERHHGMDDRYLHYLLRSERYITGYLSLSKGIRINQWDLDPTYHSRMPVLVPSMQEQRDIVDLLDRETGQIDDLIGKQERLIELLGEKRQAIITHAVTKGLDPNAPTKPSGFSWLGHVPSHWTVPQLGMHARVGNGSTPNRDTPEYWSGGEIPWLNSSHVNREEITDTDQFVTEAATAECHLPLVEAESLLVGLTGQGRTRGMTSILRFPAAINQHVAYVTPEKSAWNSEYLLWFLRCSYDRLRELSDENGSTKGALTCSAIKKLPVVLPPLCEQGLIAAYVSEQLTSLDRIVAASTAAIGILNERRSALISAAVTGKIDVRKGVATP